MLYALAILLPPLAVLIVGKPFQAVMNFFLTLLIWIPGSVHAILVVNNHYADKRFERLEEAQSKRFERLEEAQSKRFERLEEAQSKRFERLEEAQTAA